jgi:hypothetical protein
MKPSDIFGVVVRSLGLVLVLGALAILFFAFLNLFLGGPGNILGMLICAIPQLFVGVWFLSGAESLVRLAYQKEFEKEL